MIIDRKFKILAVNPCNGKIYTEKNSILLCAKDKAVVPALKEYLKTCIKLDCHAEHIMSIMLLMQRVINYQKNIESKTTDTYLDCEIERCIESKNLED